MSVPVMRQIALPAGDLIPVLGQGTWHLAQSPQRRREEVAALRLGVELGMTLIDTAEGYAEGEAERLVGEAIAGKRDEVCLVSKVQPGNATRRGTIEACEASLRRLNTDHLDLYLLHSRGPAPLWQTVEAFTELQENGLIRHWGVSNFDVPDLVELWEIPGGQYAQTDQVLYNLSRRVPEYGLLPWCRERDLPMMSYSPLEQGRILSHPAVGQVARRLDITPAQVALAWALQQGVSVIVRSGSRAHVRDNAAAVGIKLPAEDLLELDFALPAPTRSRPLEAL